MAHAVALGRPTRRAALTADWRWYVRAMPLRGSRLAGVALAAAALAMPAEVSAATTIGSPLTATPSSGTCGTGTFTNTALAAGTLQAPFDGVIVRWRMDLPVSGGISTYKLRVLRPAGGSTYTGAGTGPAQTAPSAGVNVLTLSTPLPVKAGDLVGVDCPPAAPTPWSNSAPAGSKYRRSSQAPRLPTAAPGRPTIRSRATRSWSTPTWSACRPSPRSAQRRDRRPAAPR